MWLSSSSNLSNNGRHRMLSITITKIIRKRGSVRPQENIKKRDKPETQVERRSGNRWTVLFLFFFCWHRGAVSRRVIETNSTNQLSHLPLACPIHPLLSSLRTPSLQHNPALYSILVATASTSSMLPSLFFLCFFFARTPSLCGKTLSRSLR